MIGEIERFHSVIVFSLQEMHLRKPGKNAKLWRLSQRRELV